MRISPQKNSIAKVTLGNGPSKAKGGINGAIKPTSKIAKSAQSGESTNATNSDTDESAVATDEGSTEDTATTKKNDAAKAAADTTKALWSMHFDLEKYKVDSKKSIEQDQLAFQKAQAAVIASQGLGALGQMMSALGGAKGGGGGSSGKAGEEEKLTEKKPFEDQNKIVKLDSKGNPITDDTNKHGVDQTSQSHQIARSEQGQESTFQGRPAAHDEMQLADANAHSYDSQNGLSIEPHTVHDTDMRSNQEENLDFTIAQNDIEEAEVQDIEIPEIEIEELEEELA
jgi:hypothetical protein